QRKGARRAHVRAEPLHDGADTLRGLVEMEKGGSFVETVRKRSEDRRQATELDQVAASHHYAIVLFVEMFFSAAHFRPIRPRSTLSLREAIRSWLQSRCPESAGGGRSCL